MTCAARQHSAKGAAASQRNGALSKGPRTARGKTASAQNSRKHGLFAAGDGNHGALSPGTSEFARYLAQLTAGRPDLEMTGRRALVAAIKAEQSLGLLESIRDELASLLAQDLYSVQKAKSLLEKADRMSRYQRRFCGQRDRALRTIIGETRSRTCARRRPRAPDGTFAGASETKRALVEGLL